MQKPENKHKTVLSFPQVENPVWIPVPKRIRVFLSSRLIADSTRTMLLRGRPPVYYFPREDVKMDFLKKSNHNNQSEKYGKARHWHVDVDEQIAVNAAWSYENPPEGMAGGIADYIAFKWPEMETWMEEEEVVRVHPRDPYSRIDVICSSRYVKLQYEGLSLAETRCPMVLFETGLPARYYIRRSDVNTALLKPSDHQTECPYKGVASHFSLENDEWKLENIAWTYAYPNQEVAGIKDLICFYAEKLEDFFVDGNRLPKAETPWSE